MKYLLTLGVVVVLLGHLGVCYLYRDNMRSPVPMASLIFSSLVGMWYGWNFIGLWFGRKP